MCETSNINPSDVFKNFVKVKNTVEQYRVIV